MSNFQAHAAAMMNSYIKQVPSSEIRIYSGFRKTYFWQEVAA